MRQEEIDVVVIGGGPAGAAYATIAARAGLSARVLEGRHFPRHHIGESLLAMSIPLLQSMGVVDTLDAANFLPKTGAVFVWGRAGHRIDLGFPEPRRAYQVRRAVFDELLLQHADRSGAMVWTGQSAKELVSNGKSRTTGVISEGDHGAVAHRARLVVDASGLFQYVPKRLALPMEISGPRRIAISAYYIGAGRVPGPQATNVISEATRDGWLWFIPLDDETTSVGFVGDDEDLTADIDGMLAEQIYESRLVAELLATSAVQGKPRLLRYTNHIVTSPLWSDGRLLAGDTAMFVDPLFSTGVHGALYAATMAAEATVAWMADGADENDLAAWYDLRMRAHYRRVEAMVRLLYGITGRDSRFWRARDLQAMTAEEAATMAMRLGPISVPLFQVGHRQRTLDIPPELAELLDQIWTDPDPRHEVSAGQLMLEEDVRIVSTFVQCDGRVVPALAARPATNDRPTVEVPEDTSDAALLRQLSDGPVERSAWWADSRLAALVGVLQSSGLVREADPAVAKAGG